MREDAIQFLILVFLCLMAGLIMLFLLYWGFRRLKRALKDSSSFQCNSAWSIEQINELHKSGQLTDKQYRSLRDAVIRSTDRRSSPKNSQR